MFLLSVADTGVAASLVQGCALSRPSREGSARRTARIRYAPQRRCGSTRLGQQRRTAVPGVAATSGRHRRLDRGGTCRVGFARRHDRHRYRASTRSRVMNGAHDLGGMHGFGPLNPEPNEPGFHHDWERRVSGVAIAGFGGGYYNTDQFRHAIERMGPVEYLSTSYYEHWLAMLETLLIERGVITKQELDARREQLGREAR